MHEGKVKAIELVLATANCVCCSDAYYMSIILPAVVNHRCLYIKNITTACFIMIATESALV